MVTWFATSSPNLSESCWRRGAILPCRPQAPNQTSVTHYDVIVLGLGGMGSAAACHLASRGQRVLGLEQFTPPHSHGSSHGRTRVIRQAYFEHPAYVPLLQRAYELWHRLERDTDRQLLLLSGGLMMGGPTSEVVEGSLRSAREHGLAHQLLDANAIRKRFPNFLIPDDTIGLFEESAGIVYCEQAIESHLAVAARCGAQLHFEEPVLEWIARDNGSVEVRSAREVYTAEKLIITPGPWAPRTLADLGLPLTVERQVLFWFRPARDSASFAPGPFPIYIWQPLGRSILYGFPAVDGPEGSVKVAFFRKPASESCTPETADRRVREDDIEEIRAALRDFLPALDGELVFATTCLYTLTPDLNFVIGPHPAHPQVTIAAGFSGHGFKFCSVVGELLAELSTDGRTGKDISLFDPRRFSS